MKAETLNSKIIKNLYTNKGTLARKYEDVLYMLTHPQYVARPCKWQGYTTLKDTRERYTEALKAIGVDYEMYNVAPRGGMEGWRIRLTPKGRRQVREFAKAYKA